MKLVTAEGIFSFLLLSLLYFCACRSEANKAINNTHVESLPSAAQTSNASAIGTQQTTTDADSSVSASLKEQSEAKYDFVVGIAGGQEARLPVNLAEQVMREDKEVQQCVKERYDGDAKRFASDFEDESVKQLELNHDGQPDFILLVGGCGSATNAPVFVYQSTPHNYKRLLSRWAIGIQSLPSSSNGFRDLQLFVHVSGVIKYIYNYEYASGTYHEKKCAIRRLVKQPNGTDEPQITPAKCSELN